MAQGPVLRPSQALSIFLMCWGHREVEEGLKYILYAVFECFWPTKHGCFVTVTSFPTFMVIKRTTFVPSYARIPCFQPPSDPSVGNKLWSFNDNIP